ncbi:hypothetical protein BGZ52_000592, partial [Haplosporangium bisporale]
MNLYERVLAVLSCRVVIDASHTLANSIMDIVNTIIHSPSHSLGAVDPETGSDRYQLAKGHGLYSEIRNEENTIHHSKHYPPDKDHRT